MDKFNIFSFFRKHQEHVAARNLQVQELLGKFVEKPLEVALPRKIRKQERKNKRKRELRRKPIIAMPRLDGSFPYIHCEDAKAFDSGHGFGVALRKKGFIKLGGGAHATVYAKKDSNRVIKVLAHPGDGWIDYIRWASEKGYAGRFAPKVFSYKYIKGREHDFAIASMERMNKTLRNLEQKHQMAFMANLFSYATAHDNDNAKKLVDIVVPGMADFSDQLKSRFGHGWDFHEDNFMVRTDGSLAIIDPVSGVNTKDVQKRFKIAA